VADLDDLVYQCRPCWHRGQPLSILRYEFGGGPADGVTGQMVEAVHRVDAGADLVVIPANHGGIGQRLHAFDHGVGIRTVPDEISEHEHSIAFTGRCDRGLHRLEIRVDITQDQVAHLVAR
jgi:hypothetical protein